ncbi:CPBP family intramembrane glutamic endopeptidase [Halorussus pelagicus]|uniref:CPBP family intramembrane glutamic endopeptidase n=1 Tax=Halorussus pelagicus TaxID=2505977 RepID=UPI000FFB8FEA|nr:type II CAAX endopeptidase family protein [Halorussus pelagicus]
MSMHGTLFAKTKSFVGKETRLRAFTVALGLTALGSIASFVTFLVLRGVLSEAFGDPLPGLVYKFRMRGVQWGFTGFVLAYLLVTREWERYVRFRRPRLADGAWVLVGLFGLNAMTEVEKVVVPRLGLSLETISGAPLQSVPLSTWPLAWPLVFAGLYLLPAMVEEQFYRGLIQTRLRGTFSTVSEIVFAAGFFSLSHQLYIVGGGPEMMATGAVHFFAQGLVFCVLYERSDNLFVPATVHALSWTSAYAILTGLIGL